LRHRSNLELELIHRVYCTRRALAQRCRHDNSWILPRWARWWVTLKTVVAIWLDIENGVDRYDCLEVAYFNWHKTSSFECGEGGEGEILIAKRLGIGYAVVTDGWP
jgi:hypothetical protein